MKKTALILVILMSFTILLCADPVAYLMQTKGSVQLYRSDRTVKFKNGELLYNKDEIITGVRSYAAVKYADGAATVKVFPNSILRLNSTKQNKQLNKSVLLDIGGVYSSIVNRIKGEYEVESPNTVASVKGTSFLMRYNADKITYVTVLEGEVMVKNKISGKSVLVKQGMTATSGEDGSVTLEETTPDDLSEEDLEQIDSAAEEALRTIRIQIINENGTVKYIDITY